MNSTPQFRHECLMRYIMNLPKERRTAFYLDVREHHGKDFARVLHTDVLEYWKTNQERETNNG